MIKYFLDKQIHAGRRHDFSQKTEGSSGFDLFANVENPFQLAPGYRRLVPTGLYLEMPDGVEAQIRGRSGLTLKGGVSPLVGTVDSDYRGEIGVCLFNLGDAAYVVEPGDRIAQVVFCPILPQFFENLMAMMEQGRKFHMNVTRVHDRAMLSRTLRGEAGHGSTG